MERMKLTLLPALQRHSLLLPLLRRLRLRLALVLVDVGIINNNDNIIIIIVITIASHQHHASRRGLADIQAAPSFFPPHAFSPLGLDLHGAVQLAVGPRHSNPQRLCK